MKNFQIPHLKFVRYLTLIFFVLIFISLSNPISNPNPSAYTIFMLTAQRGVLISKDNGNSWDSFNKGLPTALIPVKINTDSDQNLYLLTRRSGVYKYDITKNNWIDININKFLVKSNEYLRSEFRKISAFTIDEKNPRIILLATKHSIFMSRDGGLRWDKISMNGLNRKNYITAIAVRDNGSEIYAGTSFNGLYRMKNSRFLKISSGLPKEPYSGNLSFFEGISEITFDTKKTDILYTGINIDGSVFISRNRGKSWKDLEIPIREKYDNKIYAIKSFHNSLYVSTNSGIYRMNLQDKTWSLIKLDNFLIDFPKELDPLSFLIIDHSKQYPLLFYHVKEPIFQKNDTLFQRASNKKAIYASIPSIRRNFNGILKTIKECKFNSIVIDMKDDLGNLFFPSKNIHAIEIGAVKSFNQITEILKSLKENRIYSIARIVVFKDRNLYNAYNNKYSIWDNKFKRPWKGNPHEYWVDPHSDFVRRYNTDIAVEIQNIGFDEIQFDYIRFPSDGPLKQCYYRYNNTEEIYKSEVMIDFLRQARDKIIIPISVDIYGYNAWYYFGNWIGQDIEEFAQIVDVICPMVYPSHFGKRFYMDGPRELRPYKIVFNSGQRAISLMGENTVLRPYLQAFRMSSPTWGKTYINNQIKGAIESGCSGFIFWNARGDYRMVRKALSQSNYKIR